MLAYYGGNFAVPQISSFHQGVMGTTHKMYFYWNVLKDQWNESIMLSTKWPWQELAAIVFPG